MRMRDARASIKLAVALAPLPGVAAAHVSEQGFVLLLPTDLYISGGVASVALTVLLLAVLPGAAAERLMRPLRLFRLPRPPLRHATSLAAALFLWALIWVGMTGPRDPLANPLPLFVWTVWWIGLVSVQGLLFDHWRFTSPFTGPAALARALTGLRAPLRYPRALGHVPALAGFLGFAAILLADPAPADPDRLAGFVAVYWLIAMAGTLLFGPRWLLRAEWITVLMRAYGRMPLLGRVRRRLALGVPGWQVLSRPAVPLGLAAFILTMLAVGSFDGVNETFWWLGLIGINPLEFPGRSAVVVPTLTGLAVSVAALFAVFTGTIWLGLRLARASLPLGAAVRLFAPSILPIALGYHIAHYLTAFMVDVQYAVAAASDPLARGADLLGLGTFYVTTGFFNTPDTVRVIWLSQAGAVVVGHILAILAAHAQAVRVLGTGRRAALSQAPLAAFMVLYTLFGLWLLAAPRGA